MPVTPVCLSLVLSTAAALTLAGCLDAQPVQAPASHSPPAADSKTASTTETAASKTPPAKSVESPEAAVLQTVRCAVIGGLADTGVWQAISERFTKKTGHKVTMDARGPRHEIIWAMTDGSADLIVMHNCDAMINLVADGYGIDPQPWLRNDFVLVGPKGDPAGIKGMKSAAEALQKIIETRSKFLVSSSHGAKEVLDDVLTAAGLELDPKTTLVRTDDRHRQMLLMAAVENAYALVGRIPFKNGKIPNDGLEVMVQGDPQLRRPYLVIAANPRRFPKSPAAARQLAAFLREPETQAFLKDYGKGMLDDQPMFFPVEIDPH